jgi:hypothetical protein
MKAIVYTNFVLATTDLTKCLNLPHSATDKENLPDFWQPPTYLRKHPKRRRWALMANRKIELLLGKRAETLGKDWSYLSLAQSE